MKRRKLKPYFETKLGKLYHGNCLEIMPHLGPVDLVLTDPPYGLGYDKSVSEKSGQQYGKGKAPKNYYPITSWDKTIPKKEVFNLIRLKSKNQIIFGGEHICLQLPKSRGWFVWDKQTGNNNFSDCELVWTSFNQPIRKFKYIWNGMIQECMGKDKEKRYHPTQKPVGLFVQILDRYSGPNDIILDSFLGSGTTAVACEKLNRHWIGIEISEKYCEMTKQRVKYRGRYHAPHEIKSGFKLL